MSDSNSFLRPFLDRMRGCVARGCAADELQRKFNDALSSEEQLKLLEWFEKLLLGVLRRRGLLNAPGTVLGYDAHTKLVSRASEEAGGALHDLTQDIVAYALQGARLRSLVLSSEDPSWNPDFMARRNAANFIHDRQREADPVGTALYDGLQRAIQNEAATGWVRLEEGRIILAADPHAMNGSSSTGPDHERILAAFSLAGALVELSTKLGEFFGGALDERGAPRRVQLRSEAIAAQLLGGLNGLRADRVLELTVSSLISALRNDLPDGRPRLEGGAAADTTLELLAGRPDAAVGLDEPGLAQRLECCINGEGLRPAVRDRLLAILNACRQATEDGRSPGDAIRCLGIPKQTLSDAMKRLRGYALQLQAPGG